MKNGGDKRFIKVYYVGVELYNTKRTRVLLIIKEFCKWNVNNVVRYIMVGVVQYVDGVLVEVVKGLSLARRIELKR